MVTKRTSDPCNMPFEWLTNCYKIEWFSKTQPWVKRSIQMNNLPWRGQVDWSKDHELLAIVVSPLANRDSSILYRCALIEHIESILVVRQPY